MDILQHREQDFDIDDHIQNNIDDVVNYDDEDDIDVDDLWDSFDPNKSKIIKDVNNSNKYKGVTPPLPNPINISTKTMLATLNTHINLSVFWDIPIIKYSLPIEGVVKKELRFVSTSAQQLEEMQQKLYQHSFYEEHCESHCEKNTFKDIRKISVGISMKNFIKSKKIINNKKANSQTLTSKNKKTRSGAFYNCITLIYRIFTEDVFKEYHVKLFNTGELEIPGVKNNNIYKRILNLVLNTLQPFYTFELKYYGNVNTCILINSNFDCNFEINRDELNNILKEKYGLVSKYRPSSYPAVHASFYYDKSLDEYSQTGILNKIEDTELLIKNEDNQYIVHDIEFEDIKTTNVLENVEELKPTPVVQEKLTKKTGKISKEKIKLSKKCKSETKKIAHTSFMVFGTGKILIVGSIKNTKMLSGIYNAVVKILTNEFENICLKIKDSNLPKPLVKPKKILNICIPKQTNTAVDTVPQESPILSLKHPDDL